MKIELRYAKIGEADLLASINAASFQKGFKGIIPDEVLNEKFAYGRLLERFTKELAEKNTENSILLIDDKPVGIQTFGRDDHKEREPVEIDIWRLYILPECWGMGYGEILIKWGLEELKKKNYKKVALWVVDENTRARRFYEKMGFLNEGEYRIINPGKEIEELRYVKYL